MPYILDTRFLLVYYKSRLVSLFAGAGNLHVKRFQLSPNLDPSLALTLEHFLFCFHFELWEKMKLRTTKKSENKNEINTKSWNETIQKVDGKGEGPLSVSSLTWVCSDKNCLFSGLPRKGFGMWANPKWNLGSHGQWTQFNEWETLDDLWNLRV